jgi:hypothetical protein
MILGGPGGEKWMYAGYASLTIAKSHVGLQLLLRLSDPSNWRIKPQKSGFGNVCQDTQ